MRAVARGAPGRARTRSTTLRSTAATGRAGSNRRLIRSVGATNPTRTLKSRLRVRVVGHIPWSWRQQELAHSLCARNGRRTRWVAEGQRVASAAGRRGGHEDRRLVVRDGSISCSTRGPCLDAATSAGVHRSPPGGPVGRLAVVLPSGSHSRGSDGRPTGVGTASACAARTACRQQSARRSAARETNRRPPATSDHADERASSRCV
jgi:hypothetical protein